LLRILAITAAVGAIMGEALGVYQGCGGGCWREISDRAPNISDVITEFGHVMVADPKNVLVINSAPNIDVPFMPLERQQFSRIEGGGFDLPGAVSRDKCFGQIFMGNVSEGIKLNSRWLGSSGDVVLYVFGDRPPFILHWYDKSNETVSCLIANLFGSGLSQGEGSALDRHQSFSREFSLDDGRAHDDKSYRRVNYRCYYAAPNPYAIYALIFLIFGALGLVLIEKSMPERKEPSGYLLVAGWLSFVVAMGIPAFGFITHPENAFPSSWGFGTSAKCYGRAEDVRILPVAVAPLEVGSHI
jgi:hypothetical protein